MARHVFLALLPLVALVASAGGADLIAVSKPAPGLTTTLVSAKDSYPLDPAQSGEAFRKSLAGNGRKPAASKVDLTLRVNNPTDHAITFSYGGDDSNITFNLEGPGATTVQNNVMMTREFRPSEAITLKPGETHAIKIASLAGGLRGVSQMTYFTEPGDYKLSATLTCVVGEVQVKIKTEAIAFKVAVAEEKK